MWFILTKATSVNRVEITHLLCLYQKRWCAWLHWYWWSLTSFTSAKSTCRSLHANWMLASYGQHIHWKALHTLRKWCKGTNVLAWLKWLGATSRYFLVFTCFNDYNHRLPERIHTELEREHLSVLHHRREVNVAWFSTSFTDPTQVAHLTQKVHFITSAFFL